MRRCVLNEINTPTFTLTARQRALTWCMFNDMPWHMIEKLIWNCVFSLFDARFICQVTWMFALMKLGDSLKILTFSHSLAQSSSQINWFLRISLFSNKSSTKKSHSKLVDMEFHMIHPVYCFNSSSYTFDVKNTFLVKRFTHNGHKIGHCLSLSCTLHTSVAEWVSVCAFPLRSLEINWLSLIEMRSPFLAPPVPGLLNTIWNKRRKNKTVQHYRDSDKWNHLLAVRRLLLVEIMMKPG